MTSKGWSLATAGVTGCSPENGGDLLPQDWTPVERGPPNHVPFNSEVSVDQDVPESYDLRHGISEWLTFRCSETRDAASPIVASF